jgi:hypothetical protein
MLHDIRLREVLGKLSVPGSEQFQHLCVLQIPQTVIHETMIPLVFRMLENGVRSVMVPAASALCTLFRKLTKERHRTEVLIRIIRDFAHSRSSVHRLSFVHLARAALATFSASFFCSHLLMHLLPLATDASLAVRSSILVTFLCCGTENL